MHGAQASDGIGGDAVSGVGSWVAYAFAALAACGCELLVGNDALTVADAGGVEDAGASQDVGDFVGPLDAAVVGALDGAPALGDGRPSDSSAPDAIADVTTDGASSCTPCNAWADACVVDCEQTRADCKLRCSDDACKNQCAKAASHCIEGCASQCTRCVHTAGCGDLASCSASAGD